jgi:hypothetical protein
VLKLEKVKILQKFIVWDVPFRVLGITGYLVSPGNLSKKFKDSLGNWGIFLDFSTFISFIKIKESFFCGFTYALYRVL